MEFQLALQRHLARHGFPTAAVVETVSHRPFATDEDGVPWVLFAHVEGDEYDFQNRERVTAAAQCLARFHLVTESFRAEAPGPEYKAPIRQCWANVEQDLRELAEMLDGDSTREALAYLAGWWRSVLREWPLERLDALPAGWLHGDYHGRNLVFDGDRVAGLFDFDDVDAGPYAYDVAAGLYRFGREGRGSLSIRLEYARLFVAGYETVRPISHEERAALPVMVATGYPPNPRHYRYWRDRRGEQIEGRFLREVTSIRTLHAEMQRIGPELFRSQED
jgi:homoserine kinase type II